MDKVKIKWLPFPEEHDYPAAANYLSLFYDANRAEAIVISLRDRIVEEFKAKDIFRASELSLLGISNFHIKRDIKKIKDGKRLSPLLLVRNPNLGKVIIADGYHRMCAIYTIDEDAVIKCKIV